MKDPEPINLNQALREGITHQLTHFVSGSSSQPSLSYSPSEQRQRLSDVIAMALAVVEDGLLSDEPCSDEILIRENSVGECSNLNLPRKQ
jgi:ABC-type phosphate transport system ATPase subunit